MIKYKLTTEKLTTYRDFQWKIGEKVVTSGVGDLCGRGWLHYYHHAILAPLLNPMHSNFENPKLFKVEAEGVHLDDYGLKGGCTEMTLLEEVEIPEINETQKLAFAILAVKIVSKSKYFPYNPEWLQWLENWLSNKDRTSFPPPMPGPRMGTESEILSEALRYYMEYTRIWGNKGVLPGLYIANVIKQAAYIEDGKLDLISIANEALKY